MTEKIQKISATYQLNLTTSGKKLEVQKKSMIIIVRRCALKENTEKTIKKSVPELRILRESQSCYSRLVLKLSKPQ